MVCEDSYRITFLLGPALRKVSWQGGEHGQDLLTHTNPGSPIAP